MDLEPGKLVTSNVRLLRPLREGGMGLVWIAEHLTLKTQVAVKFVSEELLAEDPEIRTRFQNEASLAAQIKSEHVVHTYDQGLMDDDTPYIVMELLEGNTLTDWVELMGPLDVRSGVVLVNQLAKALRRAHRMGIIHRDIKSDNIFLVDTEEAEEAIFAKILDFGIAKHTRLPELDMGTKPGTIVGTPEFMSPEQMLAEGPIDAKADLWALAVVAYYALTGAIPFGGNTLVKLCLAVLDGSFAPPSTHRTDLPPNVDRWFAKALAREPEDRFASARDMALAFQYAAGMPMDPLRSGAGGPDPSSSGALAAVVDEPSSPGAEGTEDEPAPPRTPELTAGTHATFTGAASPVRQTSPRRRRGPGVAFLMLAGLGALAVGVGLAMLTESRNGERPAADPAAAPEDGSGLVDPEPTGAFDLPDGGLPAGAVPAADTVLVAAGDFSMGCAPDDDPTCQPDEQPRHEVWLPAFVIDRLEVSVARYAACVRAGRCTDDGLRESELCNFAHADRADQPVNCVDWHQASSYCRWVGMRLPTEAEWEKAARGVPEHRYPWGDDPPDCERAVFDEQGDGCGRDSTWPVGSKPAGASPCGALDLAGNVWEWVADRYDDRYYQRSPRRRPAGPEVGSSRGVRGGSWLSKDPEDLRAAQRHASQPEHRNYNLGFRCAADAPDEGSTPPAANEAHRLKGGS